MLYTLNITKIHKYYKYGIVPMINNNTQKKNNVSVGTKKESEIYLKKSELPKDVSSFRNDAGYISQSTLNSWLKEHNYIPENNIKTLISSSYKIITNQDVDSYIPEIKGEIVAIKDRLGNIESGITEIKDEYAKSDDIPILTGYATEEWVEGQGYLTEHQSLDGYATEEWVESQGYLTEHQSLSAYAKKSEIPSVEGLASESWVESQGYLTEHQDISGKADKTELQNYVKTTVIRNYLKKSDMPDRNDIALVSELPTLLDDYATKEWVEDKHYLTEHQSLSAYASKNWVINQHYLTEHQDLSDYVKLEDIPDISNLATKSEIPSLSGYVKTSTLSNYAKKSDLNGYLKESDVNALIESYDFPTLSDLDDIYAKKDFIPDMSGYVKTSTLSNYARVNDVYSKVQADSIFLSKEEAADKYPTKTAADAKYLSKMDASIKYLQIEDYRGIGDATIISDEFADNTVTEFNNEIGQRHLRNGFYIVEENKLFVIKDNSALQLVENGTSPLMWREI